MNKYDKSLQASLWVMVIVQTIGSIDLPNSKNAPYSVARKMPAPKQYVAIVVAWSVLHLASDAGFDRGAAAAGWVITLAGMVLGPFGKTLTSFLQTTAQEFPTNPEAQQGQTQQASPSTQYG